MTQNVKTPARGEGFGRDVALRADTFSIALTSLEIQIRRFQKQLGYSRERAAVEASHCYGVADDRRAQA